MRPLTEQEIRTSFVNCTKGEAKRLHVPRDLAERPWDDLDFLGWRDPQAPGRAYLVAAWGSRPVGVQLRSSDAGSWQTRRSMCSMCVTTHTGGVSLLVAPRSGKAGQQGNSVGAYMCSDLACSLYVRGKKDAGIGARLHESLTLEEKIRRTVANLSAFIAKVTE
ncbi:FBP domain-containing protein [Streptomyces bacillaris]|uniref:FBP domain-containing protein n=1 Tax=Streptomyces cavourensis TaxID=67258 RepID=A0AAD0Q053_9ACTN|nr:MULTISPECIES: FBP domain-containing protein [Streptomyces]ALC31601.1 FBP domain-containing protein [Streptomyces sp. CFMR 7]ATY94036.1 FBP domain-containing protein [Streptomyces cavourensis]AXI69856.1 FBP domain-containing protein [Streptomyces cavourensis]MBH0242153.1 FBP domain-containing protein [Streptomyces cavourensis]NUV43734.1 FBP domain-containing protein [Streptomyces sp. CAI-24]